MREFDHQLLRLKQALGLSADQDVAAALDMGKTAFSDRKRRGAFPTDKVRALAGARPELRLDLDYILKGTSDSQKELNRRLAIVKSSTDKVRRLGLPADQGAALQEILFFVEMEDAAGLGRALQLLTTSVPAAPADAHARRSEGHVEPGVESGPNAQEARGKRPHRKK